MAQKGITKWRRMDMPHGTMYVFARVYAHVYVRVCARVCAHVCARVIREIKHPFQDNTNSLITQTLYTHLIA